MKKRTSLYFCTLALFGGVYFSPPLYADTNKGLMRTQEETKFRQENKVAIVVGVGAYDNNSGLRRLAYATKDASGIANALRQQDYTVRLLMNHKANKGYILSAIKQAGKLLKKNTGTLIFVYSGHGFANGNINYLASYGTTSDRLASSALTLREVEQEIRNTGARRAMLFVDACRDNPNTGNATKNIKNQGFVDNQSYGLKRLQSTQNGNVSVESSQLGHGVFSYYLIKALKGEGADRTGLITFRGIENYVKSNVKKWSYQQGKARVQIPISRGNSSGVLVLGRKAGTTGTPPPPELDKPSQHEQRYWQASKKCNQAACYQNYLSRYPQGKYASLARRQIQAVKQPKPPSALVYRPQPPQRQQSFEPQMRLIRGGRFQMGSPASEKNRGSDEKQHSVQVGDFWMAKTEVTFDQWQVCVNGGGCQSNKKPDDEGWGRGNRPVINVSWHDANEYANWLSKKTGKDYRLPTEAQWEYAARGKSTSRFHFGNNEAELCNYGNHADKSVDYPWKNKSCSDGVGKKTAPVGNYKANQYGLQDMHGNV
ncbi:MAG: SUMF1/EgtB/PvdO family nonheme iron enzyme, partial [Cocleimonas sp.]|nr:SUMF1/EgtB/PvdO family nonheme iron enzyme [Cocleimonas sp.]